MSRDQKLAQVLVEFAHTLGSDFSIESILDRLVQRVVDVLPITAAGVMVMRENDSLHFLAASNTTIEEIESLQNEFDEGPCLDAYRSGEPVAVPDLGLDKRFPRFSPRALTAGLAAVFTFPMRLDGPRLGALDLYRDTPGELSAGDMRAAQVLADVAAAYLFNARARNEATDHLVEARHRNLHDPLTGVANRTLLTELLERAVARSARSHLSVAVLFVDLDRFKAVNDEFGHHAGDLVLRAVAARLSAALRPGDTLARLAGDEFVILCEDMGGRAQAELVARRIGSAFDEPFDVGDGSVRVTASVGIAFSGPGEDIPESLLRDADFAMYEAKAAGGAHHRFVDRAARSAAENHAHLEAAVREALHRDEFRLAYQPIVRALDGALVGVEALLRWPHPERGLVPPDVVIPIAERSGLILPLGQWVLRQACEDFMSWRGSYGVTLSQLAVNVSAHQVMAPGFSRQVADVLQDTAMDPGCLHLEVTESVLLEDVSRAREVMSEIGRSGVRFSLDDFGMGYSGLSYLRLFPFDDVKIDGSFVGGPAGMDATTRAIVASMIGLAEALHLTVIAEGIETEQQRTQLSDLGAELAQGYLLGRPLFAADLQRDVLEPACSAAGLS